MVGQVSNLIKAAVESCIGSKPYDAEAVGKWSGAILEKCVASLIELDKPFKVGCGESCYPIFKNNWNCNARNLAKVE